MRDVFVLSDGKLRWKRVCGAGLALVACAILVGRLIPESNDAKFRRVLALERMMVWLSSPKLKPAVDWIDRCRSKPLAASLWKEYSDSMRELDEARYFAEIKIPFSGKFDDGFALSQAIWVERTRSKRFCTSGWGAGETMFHLHCDKRDEMHWRSYVGSLSGMKSGRFDTSVATNRNTSSQ